MHFWPTSLCNIKLDQLLHLTIRNMAKEPFRIYSIAAAPPMTHRSRVSLIVWRLSGVRRYKGRTDFTVMTAVPRLAPLRHDLRARFRTLHHFCIRGQRFGALTSLAHICAHFSGFHGNLQYTLRLHMESQPMSVLLSVD
jgi:hypothetical protein